MFRFKAYLTDKDGVHAPMLIGYFDSDSIYKADQSARKAVSSLLRRSDPRKGGAGKLNVRLECIGEAPKPSGH